jgi:hypothetical protein
VFCSIPQQRQGFQRLEGLGLVVGLSSARLIALGLPDFRTDSGFQVSAMWAWWSVFARFPINLESCR